MQDASIYRPKIMRLLAVAALSGFSIPALANVSLKAHLEQSPSSAIWGDSENFIVTGEQLSFHCAPESVESFEGNYCDVSAAYHIRAAKAETATLKFILPTDGRVHWDLDGTGGTVEAAFEAEATNASGVKGDDEFQRVPTVIGQIMENKGVEQDLVAEVAPYSTNKKVNIFSAEFQAKFIQGDQVLRVDYQQPLGFSDEGFRLYPIYDSTKLVRSFGYEVWPLKNWTLAPDFEMTTTLTMPRAYFSGFQRLTGQYGRVSCNTPGGIGAPTAEREISMDFHVQDDVVVGTFVFSEDDLPDRFSCLLQ